MTYNVFSGTLNPTQSIIMFMYLWLVGWSLTSLFSTNTAITEDDHVSMESKIDISYNTFATWPVQL